jgi:hypothetical protein
MKTRKLPKSGGAVGFDVDALYAAIDEQRKARGLSWSEAAREMGNISPSTVSGIRGRRALEGDGVLAMLRWVKRTPESFMLGDGVGAIAERALPTVERWPMLRFDAKAIYSALNAQRVKRCLTWRQVAREIGHLNATGLTRLAKGGRVSFPGGMRIFHWLGRPAAEFTRYPREPKTPSGDRPD